MDSSRAQQVLATMKTERERTDMDKQDQSKQTELECNDHPEE